VDGPEGSRRIISLEDARPLVELERARSELHALVEATDSVVLSAGLEGRGLRLNEAARAWLGLQEASGGGPRSLFDLVDEETAAALRDEVNALGGEERVWRGLGTLRRPGRNGVDVDEDRPYRLLAVLRPRQRGAEGSLTLVARL
jgi:PAS domain-containing protein